MSKPHLRNANHEIPHDDGESIWLVSYADMVTLLMGFFVLLLSFSKMDPDKLEKVKKASTETFGGEYKIPFEGLTKSLKDAMSAAGVTDQVIMKQNEEGVEVTFRGALFFDSGMSNVKDQARMLLTKVVPVIKSQAKQFNVVIEGHTDNVAMNSTIYPSNWELSSVRACSVLRVFEEFGFNPLQLQAIGWGDTRPVASNDTPDSRSQNRRVVIRILRKPL